MPKFLPKTARKSSGFTLARSAGFTLVELLVVVSIIAVLSVMGIVVLGNVQKGARDARRKADIQAISKALEVNYDDAAGQYIPLTDAMFAGNKIPQDPMQGRACGSSASPACKYCVLSAPGNCTGLGSTTNNVSTTNPPAGTTYTICTNLENGTGTSSYYCLSNQR